MVYYNFEYCYDQSLYKLIFNSLFLSKSYWISKKKWWIKDNDQTKHDSLSFLHIIFTEITGEFKKHNQNYFLELLNIGRLNVIIELFLHYFNPLI